MCHAETALLLLPSEYSRTHSIQVLALHAFVVSVG